MHFPTPNSIPISRSHLDANMKIPRPHKPIILRRPLPLPMHKFQIKLRDNHRNDFTNLKNGDVSSDTRTRSQTELSSHQISEDVFVRRDKYKTHRHIKSLHLPQSFRIRFNPSFRAIDRRITPPNTLIIMRRPTHHKKNNRSAISFSIKAEPSHFCLQVKLTKH